MNDEVKTSSFQAFLTTKGRTEFGLLVIDRTVKAYRGEIRFESELNKGTKFIFSCLKNFLPIELLFVGEESKFGEGGI